MSKKDQVIESARDLFYKYGYKKVSMDDIAQKSNVTKKTIYTYFKDKDDLFSLFIEEELDKLKTKIEKEKKDKSLIDCIPKIIFHIFNFRENSLLIKNLIIESNKNDKIFKFLNSYDKGIINYIEENIKLEISNNQIRNCNSKLMAFIIYKIFISVLFEYDKEIDLNEISEEVTMILKKGLVY